MGFSCWWRPTVVMKAVPPLRQHFRNVCRGKLLVIQCYWHIVGRTEDTKKGLDPMAGGRTGRGQVGKNFYIGFRLISSGIGPCAPFPVTSLITRANILYLIDPAKDASYPGKPYTLKILCLTLTTSNTQMYILDRWNFVYNYQSLEFCFICNHRVFLIFAKFSRNAASC